MRSLIGGQPVERAAFEANRAGLVVERAANAIDERALARTVRPDQPETFALGQAEVDALQGNKAPKAFANGLNLEQWRRHGLALARRQSSTRPMMPFGAITTNPTSRTPTINKLTADEMVTVAICCSEPSRIAPISGPNQLVVPPIIGMAMELTA